VHTRATRGLQLADSTIASQWALDTLVKKSDRPQRVWNVYDYVNRNTPGMLFNRDEYASGCGELWAAAAHLRLIQGGVFRSRDSVTGISSNVTHSSSTAAAWFTDTSEISAVADGTYCRPYSHTRSEQCPLIGALRQPTHLYILNTAEQKSSYTAEHLWAVVSSPNCKPHEVVTLYWVVSPNRFDKFKVLHTIEGIEMLHVDAQMALRSAKHVVLEVDVELYQHEDY
jgi:hypothetical protein